MKIEMVKLTMPREDYDLLVKYLELHLSSEHSRFRQQGDKANKDNYDTLKRITKAYAELANAEY